MRNLMIYTRESTLFANGALPIKQEHVVKAIRQTANVLTPLLWREDWKRLAALELSENQEWENNSPAERRLLENLCVMEYINGEDEENPLVEITPWYAVNPILRVQRSFKSALEAAERRSETEA